MGISSLAMPPAHSSSSGSSSAGGALGVTPTALTGMPMAQWPGLEGSSLDGDKFTAMFPMYMGRVTTASGDFRDTCNTNTIHCVLNGNTDRAHFI